MQAFADRQIRLAVAIAARSFALTVTKGSSFLVMQLQSELVIFPGTRKVADFYQKG